MKKLLTVLVTMMSVSSAFACMGGDLIQIVAERDGQKMILASYNKITGMQTFVNANVKSIRGLMLLDESACTTDSCNQLKVMQSRRVQFQIELQDGSVERKTIARVTINPDQGHAKSMPQFGGASNDQSNKVSGIELDSQGNEIYNCSTKD